MATPGILAAAAAGVGVLLLAARAAVNGSEEIYEEPFFEPDPFIIPSYDFDFTFEPPDYDVTFELPAWELTPPAPALVPVELGTPMRTGAAGIALIKRWEGGPYLTAYRDPGGVPTIGWGHTGPDVRMGLTITRQRAQDLFDQDLRDAESAVFRYVTVPLTQGQFDALVSFVFNVGAAGFSTSTLRRKLNARDYAGAAAEFDRWVYDKEASPDPLPGLVSRRNQEQALFQA